MKFMGIKISNYIQDSVEDGNGIRLTINYDKNGYELDFKQFQEILNESIQFDDIGGVTFNDVDDFSIDSPFLPYIRYIVGRRLNIRITSNIKYEEIKDSPILKYINYYYDDREIDVQESRKKNSIVRVA